MIFDDIPCEIKEYIFSYVSPDDWINTAKVSKEWLLLTLGSIKRVESCHILALDHLAEFINKERKTNYTWISLLALMPKLEHLECFENTEAFWNQIRPICDQLKVLHCHPENTSTFDWNQLDIGFKNLTELLWHRNVEKKPFLFRILELAPQLKKLTLKSLVITSKWQNKISKNVRHIVLDMVDWKDKLHLSTNFLCKDPSSVETFSVVNFENSLRVGSQDFDLTPCLKSLELTFLTSQTSPSAILCNAFRKCQSLETVKAHGLTITDSWRRAIPENVKSICFTDMKVKKGIRRDFSFDWLFQNYGRLKSLQVDQYDWSKFDAQKFISSENLKKLALHNHGAGVYFGKNKLPVGPFSGICLNMARGSHLVDITLQQPVIDGSWRNIFPSTVKNLRLKNFWLSGEAYELFSPQFICEDPSNIELFFMADNSDDELSGMDLNAFSGMNKLKELHLIYSHVSSACLQSILMHCCALTDLILRKLEVGALSKIPHDLALASLRSLRVEQTVHQSSLLVQHFPKLSTVTISVDATEDGWSDVLSCLHEVDTAEITMKEPSWDVVRFSFENIDHSKFRYLCLSHSGRDFGFYVTNSLSCASRKLYCYNFQVQSDVLWIKNYPVSPLLRKSLTMSLPSTMEELSHRFLEIFIPNHVNWPNYSDCQHCKDRYKPELSDEEFYNYWHRSVLK